MFKGFSEGLEWTGIASTLIFLTVFIIAIVMVVLKRKKDVDYMANLPLEDNEVLEDKIKK